MGSNKRKRPAPSDHVTVTDTREQAEIPSTSKRRVSDEGDKENREKEANRVNQGIPVKSESQDEAENRDVRQLASASLTSPIARINAPGTPPEAGVIKKVYVENFMCHRKLTVELCRNVNFIHGQNGSGKSAILAAIQICLGAGARRTHRARNLKELVRKEAGDSCTGAKVRVTLLNGGDDGFQREKYGDTITVERTISLRGGYNGYKLLDHEGKEVSRHKKDLDAMLDQLNIQVENPVAVLDQEEAKKFLTGKPEDKYAFFTKATELERIDRSYASVLDNIHELVDTKHRVQEAMKGTIENVKMLRKEWEQYKELEHLEGKVLDHQVDYAWAFYNQVNREVLLSTEKLQIFQAKKAKREQELTQAESLTGGPNDEQEQKKEHMDQLIEEARSAANAKTSLESELKRATAPVKQKERDLIHISREHGLAVANLQAAKKHLQEERDKILESSGSAQSEEAKRAANIQQAEQEIEELQRNDNVNRQSIAENLRMYEELEPHVEQAKQNVQSLDSQLRAVRYKIKELQSNEKDSLAMFGRKCAKVHELVERSRQNGRWKGKVVGPLGAYIKIVPGKEHYAAIAELAMGSGNLDRFIVTNDHDRQLYTKIRQEAGCSTSECNVFQTSPGPRYRVPEPSADGVETIASCLHVSDDLVFNSLVDQARIDQRALCKSKEASERSLLVRDANGNESINGMFKEVYFLPQGDYWKVIRGSRMLVSNERKLKQTIGVDKSAALVEANREIKQLESELKECQSKEAKVQHDRKEYQVKWNNERRKHREASARIEKLTETISRLRAEAEEAANVSLDTAELEEDVNNAKQIVRAVLERKAEVEREVAALLPLVQEIQTRLDEVAARNEKVLAEMNAAEQDLASYMQSVSQQQDIIEKKKTKLQQMEDIIAKHDSHVQKLSADRDRALRKARLLQYRRELGKKKLEEEQANAGDIPVSATPIESTIEPSDEILNVIEPIEIEREPAFYRSKIERVKKQIEKERERRALSESDPEVACEKYMRAQKDLDTKLNQIETIDKNVELLAADLKERKKRWKQFRQHIVTMTNQTFDEMLNMKGSSGELEFDHKELTLNIIVQKDNSQDSSQTKDVKALSGGERSFTTLSLLLALGERLETPFRVMDEFDVFLDPVSRKIALDALVSVAKQMVHRQFIFITPQDVSSVEPGPMLRIHQMKPPNRNGRVGGPSQQTLDFVSQASG